MRDLHTTTLRDAGRHAADQAIPEPGPSPVEYADDWPTPLCRECYQPVHGFDCAHCGYPLGQGGGR